MPNNQYGYCPGCEADPRIQILKCSSCRKPFAVSVTQSAVDCQECAVRKAMGSFRRGR